MNDQQDSELINRYLAGDNAAFGELYRKYYRRVHAFCRRMGADRADADEIVQAAFVKAVESVRTLENPGLFYYWIFTLVRNEAYGFKRKKGRAASPIDEDEVWDMVTPFDTLVRSETSRIVLEAMGRLKLEYREVLVLKHHQHLSYAEIALVTGDTISAVESRLFKARKALAALLQPYWDNERTS